MIKTLPWIAAGALALAACQTGPASQPAAAQPPADTLRYAEETHLRNVRQLTFGGDNAEAYFSFDGKSLSFQRTRPEEGIACDQIFIGAVPAAPGEAFRMDMISTGKGRTTCSYFLPDGAHVLYASTHLAADSCPPAPDRAKIRKYVWAIYDGFDIFVADTAGNIVRQLTNTPGYDAEATISPKGDRIVFTSTRDGDLDLYTMNLDGSDVRRITSTLGYDGGAFFSPDGSKLVFRASRPQTEEEVREYKELLAQGLVAPNSMEVFVCNADGSDVQQVTKLGKANWAPFFHPSGEKIIFASNHASEGGRLFNLYLVKLDGSGLERLTYDTEFDAFPMFSPDGKQLVFASNRNNGDTRYTNIFVADWVE
jgi:dipeptidyl aminopeptidase/acylaminoacyl peptidase